MNRIFSLFGIAFVTLATLTACGTDLSDDTFTCDIGTACAEYEAVDAAAANELKAQCGGEVTDGQTCSGYLSCCYHEGDQANAWTWTDDPNAAEACAASYGSPCN